MSSDGNARGHKRVSKGALKYCISDFTAVKTLLSRHAVRCSATS